MAEINKKPLPQDREGLIRFSVIGMMNLVAPPPSCEACENSVKVGDLALLIQDHSCATAPDSTASGITGFAFKPPIRGMRCLDQ